MTAIPELKTIIAEIRATRLKHNIKSSTLAKASGISPSTMSKLEKGTLKPSYELVYNVLDALDRLIAKQGDTATISTKMTRNVISVSPTDTVSKARDTMREKGISQLPVVDDSGRIVGIITEKSILDNPEALTCDQALEFSYAVLDPDTNIERARQIIRNTQAILVVKQGKLIGLLTKTDFL